MKKYLLVILLFPQWTFAHCPLKFTREGRTYCTEAQWLPAEQKSKGSLFETQEPSPQLIPSGQIPPLWLYSKVSFPIWNDGDANHIPQQPKNLRIFPYMTMLGGHHHSASYQFTWDNTTQKFIVSGLALQSMEGCWSLYITTESNDDPATGQKLLDIGEYANLDKGENAIASSYCTDVPLSNGRDHNH